MLLLELLEAVIDQYLIKISSSQIHVTLSRFYVNSAVRDVENAHIERAATEVEDNNHLVTIVFMNACSHCSGSRLANDPQNLKTCDSRCILSRLLLRCVEICRDCHHGFFDFLATKSLLRGLAHCIKYVARDLLNGKGLLVRDPDLTAAIRSFFHFKFPAAHVSLSYGRGKRLTD